MPTESFPIRDIKGYNPEIDSRSTDNLFLLGGRNFAWDAKGPYSAYATRLLAGSSVIDTPPWITQGLDLNGVQLVATFDKIRQWSSPGTWSTINDLSATAPVSPYSTPMNDIKWTTGFLEYGSYACSKIHGFYRLDAGPVLTKLTSADIPGLPATPIAVCATNGRLIILDSSTVYWSGPNDPTDLTPTIGGAGFQVVGERISGTPLTLTAIPNGFIVWTDEGALIGEFIGNTYLGGSVAFRFFEMTTSVLPLGAFGIEIMPDGSHLIISRLGLYRTTNGQQPQALTPIFNEYLRGLLRYNDNISIAMHYSIDENRVYISMRDTTAVFTVTLALELALDKWGIFSSEHIGIYNYDTGRGKIAYTDRNGIAHRFLAHTVRGRNKEDPNNPGSYLGLDSYIQIGHIRPGNMVPTADAMFEVSEVVVARGGIDSSALQLVDEGALDSGTESTVDEGSDLTVVDTEVDESPEEILVGAATYGLELIGDTFAVDDAGSRSIIPELAARRLENDLWTGMISTEWLTLQLSASTSGEYFQLTNARLTVTYNGQDA